MKIKKICGKIQKLEMLSSYFIKKCQTLTDIHKAKLTKL